MWSFYLLIFTVLAILLLPFLLAFLIFNFFTVGLTGLGFSSVGGLLLLLLMILGSFINIPIGETKEIVVTERHFFGFMKRKIKKSSLSVNLGGAIIPLFIVAVLITEVPLGVTAFITLITTLVCYKMARPISGIGILMPFPIIPVLVVVFSSLLLAPENPESVAFVAGVLGTLLGGDLLHLPAFMKKTKAAVSVGGAGVFDGIFLIGLMSALLAGL